jgi:hypothetical protein
MSGSLVTAPSSGTYVHIGRYSEGASTRAEEASMVNWTTIK